jgi:hypothetical protein
MAKATMPASMSEMMMVASMGRVLSESARPSPQAKDPAEKDGEGESELNSL